MIDDPNNEILNQVIEESREHLQTIEPDLLNLEESGTSVDPEVINRIFRAIHSIKGGFGFFGKENITKLSHSMETVLSKVRKNELPPTPILVDVLLKGVDKLNILLNEIDASDTISIEDELALLIPFIDNNTPVTAEQPTIEKNDEPSIQSNNSALTSKTIFNKYPLLSLDKLKNALERSLFLYDLVIYGENDLIKKKLTPAKICEDFSSFSEILCMPEEFSTITNIKQIKKKDEYNLLVGSVLEPELINPAFGIDDSQIVALDRSLFSDLIPKPAVEIKTVVSEKIEIKPKSAPETQSSDALRVKVSLLDNLVNLAGELVLGRNQLMQKINQKIFSGNDFEKQIENIHFLLNSINEKLSSDKENLKTIQNDLSRIKEYLTRISALKLTDIPGLLPLIQNIDRVTSGLQENIMQTRMQPIGVVFRKFPRIIRDISKSLGKDAELILSGEDVELDKSIIELLSDPLTHLIRNSIDHGIEVPSVRKECGKQEKGMIYLQAYHEGGKVIIDISDDGAGINVERVAQKAIEKKIINQEDLRTLSEKDLQMLIFQPGFSTMQNVSNLSGRGVGMDVVKTNIEKLGGTIEIESEQKKGSRFVMKLPLTLAIIPSLLINSGGRRFAIPQVGIEELVRVRSKEITKRIHRIQGSEVLKLRKKLLPLVRLSDVLNLKTTFLNSETGEIMDDRRQRWSDRRNPTNENATLKRNENNERRANTQNAIKLAVLKIGNNNYGLVVDEISNSEEIVVKPLSNYLKSCKYYSGCTILGDGTVAMILDPTSLADASGLHFDMFEKEAMAEKEKLEELKKNNEEELLLFDNGGEEHFAVPISTISRIERIKLEDISIVGQMEFLKHDNYTIKLLRLHNYMQISPPAHDYSELYVLLPKGVSHPIGIVVCNIEDVIKTYVSIDEKNVKGSGIVGSSIIGNKMTLIMNFLHFLLEVAPELFNDN